jgi:hypothetical protein
MATSTPTPPDAGASPAIAARHQKLDSVAAQVAAIDELIGLAHHSIRVFDVDLSGMGWNDSARAEMIVAFLRASGGARLDIVVHDTGWIERSCPRLTRLLKYYGHLIAIRRTGDDAKHAMDPLLIVDDQHYLHRLHVAQPRAVLSIAEPDAAKPLVERFEAIWSSAEPGLSASALGL